MKNKDERVFCQNWRLSLRDYLIFLHGGKLNVLLLKQRLEREINNVKKKIGLK